MALKIADNFDYQGKLPNFARDTFDTLANMKAYPDTSIDEGHISLCLEDGKRYKFSASYPVDPTTGKWRKIIDSALDTTSENPIQNKTVAEKFEEVEESIQDLIKDVQDVASKQIDDLVETLSDLEWLLTRHATDISRRVDGNERTIAAALNDIYENKLGKDATINGHPIGDSLTITKSDIGLGNVDNTSDLEKPISNATQTSLNGKVDKQVGYSLVNDNLIQKLEDLQTKAQIISMVGTVQEALSNHEQNYQNPHKVTAGQVGLGSFADLTPDTMPVSTATQEELNKKVDKTFTINEHPLQGDGIVLSKDDILLNNVDNTSDANKPISKSAQEELDKKADEYMTARSITDLAETVMMNEKTVAAAISNLQQRVLKLEGKGEGV